MREKMVRINEKVAFTRATEILLRPVASPKGPR
jgi:hypothetical protein